MPSGQGRFRFNPGECELAITRVKPMINSILVEQRCKECNAPTGFGYYSDTGKEKPDRLVRCEDCLQNALNEAFKKDQSHVMRLSAN